MVNSFSITFHACKLFATNAQSCFCRSYSMSLTFVNMYLLICTDLIQFDCWTMCGCGAKCTGQKANGLRSHNSLHVKSKLVGKSIKTLPVQTNGVFWSSPKKTSFPGLVQRASGCDHISDAHYLLLDALRGRLPQIHPGKTYATFWSGSDSSVMIFFDLWMAS